MWHWLHSAKQPEKKFWFKLVGFTTLAHASVLLYLFFAYQADEVFRLTVHSRQQSHNVPVVFMPLYKRMQPTVATAVSVPKTDQIKQRKAKKTEAARPSQKNSVKALEKKPATGLVEQKTNSSKKPNLVKPQEKKTNSKNKNEQKKDVIAKSETKTKEQSKPLPSKQKKVEEQSKKNVDNQKKVVTQQPDKKEVKQDALALSSVEKSPQLEVEQEVVQPIFVGQEEMHALKLYEAIEQEIVQHWKVPAGFSKKLICELRVLVDKQGTVQAVSVHKTSGVLAYDISARTAAQAMKLPKIAWNKEFILSFKQ